ALQILASYPSGDSSLPQALDELGDGTRNTILLALLLSYAKNFRRSVGMLALEEPELYLHPHARRHLFRALREMAANEQQVILSTHSESFLDTEIFDSIGRVVKRVPASRPEEGETLLRRVSRSEMVERWRVTGVPDATDRDIEKAYRTGTASTV